MIVTSFYDIKHSAERLILNAFVPTDPGMKWQVQYKTNEDGNEIFETDIFQVPREGVFKEVFNSALDIANISGVGSLRPTDLIASRTNSNTQITRGVRMLLEGGTYVKKNHYMSEIAKKYQSQVTGVAGDIDFNYKGVNFDGFIQGKLIEAKGLGYNKLLANSNTRESVIKNLLNQAQRQTKAAGDTPLEWNFAEKDAADTFREIFEQAQIKNIEVKHKPIDFTKK